MNTMKEIREALDRAMPGWDAVCNEIDDANAEVSRGCSEARAKSVETTD